MVSQNEIHRMVHSEDVKEITVGLNKISINFPDLPDKEQAWQDIFSLTCHKRGSVRKDAVKTLGLVFPYVFDKENAWNDLISLTKENNKDNVRIAVINRIIYDAYPYMKDKEKATKDLLLLIDCKYYMVRATLVSALGKKYSDLINKEQVLKTILSQKYDSEKSVRANVAYAIGAAFPYISNKEEAIKAIFSLLNDNEKSVKGGVAYTLGVAFPYISNKEEALKAILSLLDNEEYSVREKAVYAFVAVLPHVTTDKQNVKNRLISLINDEDTYIKKSTIYAIGNAFPNISDKDKTAKILLSFKDNGAYSVRKGVAHVLGSIYEHVTCEEKLYKALIKLSSDPRSDVRISANYSLGRISIYEATLAKSDNQFKEKIENSIGFFEKVSDDAIYKNPADFCLPFYRSFYAITFGKIEGDEEIEYYLQDAKNAIEGSKSKEKLLEAVENLLIALKKVLEAGHMDLETKKFNLNAFRLYCDRACELLDSTEGTAPSAVKLMRRGLPIINERIKKTLVEIQEKSEALCEKTKGTDYEDLGKETNRIGKDLPLIRDHISLEKQTINLEEVLSAICDKMSEEKGEACRLLEKVRGEQYIEDKLPLICTILSKIPMQLRMKDFEEKLDKMLISVQPTIQEKFEISTGIEIFGTGGKHIVTIPIQAISSPELKEQLKSLSKENKTKLNVLPTLLKEKVKEYLIKKDIF